MIFKKCVVLLFFVVFLTSLFLNPAIASDQHDSKEEQIAAAQRAMDEVLDGHAATQRNVVRVSAPEIVVADQPSYGRSSELEAGKAAANSAKDTISSQGSRSKSLNQKAQIADSVKDKDSLRYEFFDLDNPQNELEVGTEIFDYSYREEAFMKLDGSMKGVFLDYQHRFNENPPIENSDGSRRYINLLMVDARFAGSGDIKYRSGGSGEHEGESHYAFETRLMGGYEIPVQSRNILLVPYAGIGYRYLLDDNGGSQTTTGAYGYDRESHYYYVPLGIEAHKFYSNRWKVRVKMEYDWFLGGLQYSHLGDVPGYTRTLKNTQNSGYGVRGSVKLARETDRFEFFMEPFVRYWHIDDSKTNTNGEVSGLEPNNRTEEYGVRLGVKF